ncbi:MAG: glycoside hydrolase family 3 C-terminal domain-containing protein [Clostridia bacterium]|nr:glycoside hydrolase family 3 C-terminal domain-containing protein [Clostridia bacterium]
MKCDIKTLTLEEKIKLLTGKNCWQSETASGKLPDVFFSDGPHGLRKIDIETEATEKATVMPSLVVLANTWDVELARLDGATIADDCIEKGADVLLAPGINIKRTPLCGRNFEYFSEDPFLAGTLAKAYIEGVQSKGIGTSLKHYCVNNREYDRFYQSSELDERTLREIYLPAFEIAVQAQPWTVMCSYNPINGVWASENKWLLNDVLREEFGFEGVIISDWGAVHNSWRAMKATLDLEMPYRPQAYQELKVGFEKGYITEAEIDARVEKILQLMEKTQNDKKVVTTTKEQRHQNALKIARSGIVLLKNEENILPLKQGSILVLGSFYGMGGGGSALGQTEYCPRSLREELAERLAGKCEVVNGFAKVDNKNWATGMRFAAQEAYGKDVVVICVGNNEQIESEAFDRTTLRLSATQEDMIINTAKVNKNVIVVVTAGSAVDMSAWIDKVKAVVFAGFGGEAASEAVADVLAGNVCPSGKLSETFPLNLADTPTGENRGDGFVDEYREGIFVGYRWYDKKEKEVLFPFGYGLSYAKFEYFDLKLEKKGATEYDVVYMVKNVSDTDGQETSQVYVRDVFAMVSRPEKELKGFTKTALKAGESKQVRVSLDARAFAYYSMPLKKWYVENGEFEILVGASSRDIRLTETISIELPDDEQVTH